ncbi:Appr-1-p processing protein [Paenibacillus farraposensis]|uniref:Appr-1-p processing protein n=1 Tax=Paenibacillus farraposensis TaxID=2807095 RepID=A0ABW4DLR9_9BACL|nr:Appr-1-p processing protein [Paenibacillus farraposensis]MCC3379182.1 Appr-1-p processing protein [Paenibacillus farraposensis]
MSIRIVQNDILQAPENIIVHQVNSQNIKAKGLAKKVWKKWPEGYAAFMAYTRTADPNQLLGKMQIVSINDTQTKFIANLFGQFGAGNDGVQYTQYPALQESLIQLREYALEKYFNIAIPYGIGCGLGGGSWNFVSGMIEDIFKDCSDIVTIYQLPQKRVFLSRIWGSFQ